MELEDIIKLVVFVAIFVLPPILKAAEKNKRAPQPSRRQVRPNQRPAPKSGQTLSEWIAEVRKVSDGPQTPSRSEPSPSQQFVGEREDRLNAEDEDIRPVQAHVSPVEVDIEAHVDPVRVDIKARYNPVHSRFGQQEDADDEDSAGVTDSARRAKPAQQARRAQREQKNSSRAVRASDDGKASIRVRKGDLKRGLLMLEILSPPLALRDKENIHYE